MGEREELSFMKKENNDLETENLFLKIKSWLYHLFHKSNNLLKPNTSAVSKDLEKNIKTNSFFEEYKLKNEKREYLLDLQGKYKSGIITESDMNQEDINELENLYIEQNMDLKRKIRMYESKINKTYK